MGVKSDAILHEKQILYENRVSKIIFGTGNVIQIITQQETLYFIHLI